jgi:ABC-type multidrug transport system permease subunit
VADLRLVLVQARYALLATARTPRVVVFGVIFPLILVVLFNCIFSSGGDQTVKFSGGTLDAEAYFTAGIVAYAIMLASFSTVAVALTTQRESGQLKRLRGTPIPAWTFMAAQILRSIVQVVITVTALILLGVIAYGVHLPAERVVALVVYVALGTACLVALGIALTVFTPTAEAASTIGPFAAVMLSFVSGVFVAVDTLPNWLESVGKIFPLYHLADGLQTCFVSGGTGTGLSGQNVTSLLVWGAVGLVIAVRRFQWEPQAAPA